MRFETPFAFLLLLLLPLIARKFGGNVFLKLQVNKSRKQGLILYFFRFFQTKRESFTFSPPFSLSELPVAKKVKFRQPVLNTLLVLSYVLLVIALARPQFGTSFSQTEDSGRDIMLTLDLSGSMSALDFSINAKTVNRLTALKYVVKKFVDERQGDRIGLIVFGDQVFTQCPLTTDRETLKSFIDSLDVGMAGERTAIGDAITISEKRIKDIKENSKVILLVTDGENNTGAMPPIEAARLAKKLGIKIHTIGIGSNGYAPMPVMGIFGQQVLQNVEVHYDEETLKTISSITGGHYFNAKDTSGLINVYEEINKLEERKQISYQFISWEERFSALVMLALLLLFIYEVFSTTYFLQIP